VRASSVETSSLIGYSLTLMHNYFAMRCCALKFSVFVFRSASRSSSPPPMCDGGAPFHTPILYRLRRSYRFPVSPIAKNKTKQLRSIAFLVTRTYVCILYCNIGITTFNTALSDDANNGSA